MAAWHSESEGKHGPKHGSTVEQRYLFGVEERQGARLAALENLLELSGTESAFQGKQGWRTNHLSGGTVLRR